MSYEGDAALGPVEVGARREGRGPPRVVERRDPRLNNNKIEDHFLLKTLLLLHVLLIPMEWFHLLLRQLCHALKVHQAKLMLLVHLLLDLLLLQIDLLHLYSK